MITGGGDVVTGAGSEVGTLPPPLLVVPDVGVLLTVGAGEDGAAGATVIVPPLDTPLLADIIGDDDD